MANFQELSNLVWNVADDVLRGLFKQQEYGDMTLPLSKWTSVATEPELDLLSNILQTLNDAYQTDFTEEDKVDLDVIRQKIQQDQDLRLVFDGDNTDSNKRFKFDQVLDNILLEFVTNVFWDFIYLPFLLYPPVYIHLIDKIFDASHPIIHIYFLYTFCLNS